MPDLDTLRSLGARIQPPALALLEETARRRDRRAAVTTVGTGLAAALLVAGGAVALGTADRDRSLPDPVRPVSPTPSPQLTDPQPDASQSHYSETSMRPREVVHADDAVLRFAGVSADDPDFRISVWTAECTWCPKQPESGRPWFNAMAVTTDGWETATYRRPPMGAARPFRVLSPAPGVLLVSDPSNGGEWLVHEDGSATVVDRVVENRPADDPRQWFECLSQEDQATWCALDVASATAYEWGDPWSQDPPLVASAVNPGVGVEPWGRSLMAADGDRELMAWFYRDDERQTRRLASGPSGSGTAGFTGDMVLGAREDLLYWSHVRGTEDLTFHVGDDGGASWRDIDQSLPSSDVTTEELVATPEGAVVLRHVTDQGDAVRARIWRLDSLEEGTWELVHDTGDLPWGADLGEMHQPTVIGSRLMWGTLYSDDDGRTWSGVDRWR
jgi:hypothetical protein